MIDWLRRNRPAPRPVSGLLVVTRDPNRIQQQSTAPIRASLTTDVLTFDYRVKVEGDSSIARTLRRITPVPTLYITEETADRLLATQGLTVADLRQRLAAMTWDPTSDSGEPFIIEPLPISMTMSVKIEPIHTVTATNVIGFLPGTDTELDGELIVVAAHYDGLPVPPGGDIAAPGAVDNGASVATMLEIVRLWREQGFQPRRTVLFAAFPGGESSLKAVEQFKNRHTVFKTLQPVAFIQLDNVAGGSGGRLLISDGDFRLHSLASRAAGKVGVGVELVHLDFSLPSYGTSEIQILGQYTNRIGPVHRYFTLPMQQAKVPTVSLRWEGSEDVIHRPADAVEVLNPDTVSRAGRVVDLLLRVLARETVY
jgi:hypothetical protein